MLAISRLRYLGRVVRLKPHSLCTLLHCHVGDRVLPWVALVSRDCDDLRARGLVPQLLGPFLQNPTTWHTFIADESTWTHVVRSLRFSDSVLDAQSSHTAPLQSGRALHSRAATANVCSPRQGPSPAIGGASTERDLSFASLFLAPFAPPAARFFPLVYVV